VEKSLSKLSCTWTLVSSAVASGTALVQSITAVGCGSAEATPWGKRKARVGPGELEAPKLPAVSKNVLLESRPRTVLLLMGMIIDSVAQDDATVAQTTLLAKSGQ